MLFFVLLLLITPTTPLFAYPEMVRHGYINCTSCHYSPNGGGLITPYGREMSREILSTWGNQGKEVQSFYGILGGGTAPKAIDVGGDLRFIQTYRDTPYVREAQFITMQADLEAALKLGKSLTAVGTFGMLTEREGRNYVHPWGSRRHYLVAKINPQMTLRAGKFFPNVGLNVADHVIATKRGLGFDEGQESYNAELSYTDNKLSISATGVLGRPDQVQLNRERGGTVAATYAILNRFKLGTHYFYGTDLGNWQRHLFGLSAILGLAPDLYLLSEMDWQKGNYKTTPSGLKTHQWGQYTYNKLGYEFLKGLHATFSHDMAYSNQADPLTKTYSVGPGLIWYPRPHYELALTWLRQKNQVVTDRFTDMAWLIMHAYF